MIRFIKAFWIALLASAAMFTSCIRIDASPKSQAPATANTPTLPAAPAAVGH